MSTTTHSAPRPRYERWTVIVGLVGLAAAFAPTTAFLLFALLPTIATATLEQNPRRSVTIAVGATNLAGAVPGLLHLWQRGASMDAAIQLLNDPRSWGWAYMGAIVGGLLVAILPRVVATMMTSKVQRQLHELEQRQIQLAAQWGLESTPKN
jgi:TctA family transporter